MTYPVHKFFKRLLSPVADRVASIIENVRLAWETREDLAQTTRLYELSTEIISASSLEEAAGLVIEKVVEAARAHSAVIKLLDKDGNLELALGPREPPPKPSGITMTVFRTGHPLTISNVEKAGRWIPPHLREQGIKSLIGLPLKAGGRTIGVLFVRYDRPHRFSDREIKLFSIYANQAAMAIERARLYEEAREALLSTIAALVQAAEAKDRYTRGHSERVTLYAMAIAEELKLPAEEIEALRQAGLLHDIGKIAVSDQILRKPNELSPEDWKAIRSHPQRGVEIIRPVSALRPLIPIILYHHERYNGKGYPKGLKGEEIPLGARILAVADAYEAMTANRPYRPAMSKREAIERLKKGAGKQFDPKVVAAFLRLLEKGLIQ